MMIDTELAELELTDDDEAALESLSWTDRMRVASTKLIKRQNLWISSLRGNTTSFASTQS